MLPQPFRQWLKRPVSIKGSTLRLPWWGLLAHSTDRKLLTELVESGQRIAQTMETAGWQDVEAVIQDWLDRYRDQAGRLGQQMQEQRGQLVLTEEDTVLDDRKRLIACAQAAALRGLVAEIRQRAKASEHLALRDQRQEVQVSSGELL